MVIFFTNHARQRIVERGITEQYIRETIARPGRMRSSDITQVKILQKEFQRRTLEVVVETIGKHIRVITAYWL